jgi:hypothetical protein
LFQIVEVIDRVVRVIDLLYLWDDSGGEVETSLWQGPLSFLIFSIEIDSGAAAEEMASFCIQVFIHGMLCQGRKTATPL